MAYDLGIDVGTTFTAAAISRDGVVEVVPLTTYQVSVPSVVFAAGHEMLFGAPPSDAARRNRKASLASSNGASAIPSR